MRRTTLSEVEDDLVPGEDDLTGNVNDKSQLDRGKGKGREGEGEKEREREGEGKRERESRRRREGEGKGERGEGDKEREKGVREWESEGDVCGRGCEGERENMYKQCAYTATINPHNIAFQAK